MISIAVREYIRAEAFENFSGEIGCIYSIADSCERRNFDQRERLRKGGYSSVSTHTRSRIGVFMHRKLSLFITCTHTAWVQCSPVHPRAHVQTPGKVQFPLCWQGMRHSGIEQSVPVHPCNLVVKKRKQAGG